MSEVKKTEALLKAVNDAKTYLGKIGAPQPHFKSGEVGKLHMVEIKTTIHHQYSSGDTNYHNDRKFDEYLALVVSRNFKALSDQAIALMENDYQDSLISEEDFLRTRLAQIEALKEQNP